MNSRQEKISDNAKAFVEGVLLDGGDLSDLMVIAAVVHTAIEKTAGRDNAQMLLASMAARQRDPA